ncbi:MAG: hypothetical protein Q7R41_05250, partial [Phycisphaerales bacterium]|nr:hypothetical protein [Phycisphaerales bacterium]
DWLHQRGGQTHGIALSRLVELLFEYLTIELGQAAEAVAPILSRDYQRGGRTDTPHVLRPHLQSTSSGSDGTSLKRVPKRQARHLGN